MSAQLRTYLESMHPLERQEIETFRSFEVESLAEKYQVTTDRVRAELKRLKPKSTAPGFLILKRWRTAILTNPVLSNAEKVAGLVVESYVNAAHLYAWPSQETLARAAGYSRGPNFGKALRPVLALGAMRQLYVKNLPVEQYDSAVRGSRRSLRAVAYRLHPVEEWPEVAAEFKTSKDGSMFHDGTQQCSMAHHLNSKGNTEPASQDSFPHTGAPTTNLESVDSYVHSMNEGNTTRRTAV